MSKGPWRNKKFDFTGIDWTRSNKDIAFELGCHVSLVIRHRMHFRRPIDFSGVDWSLPVKAIAYDLGCSESSVYNHRPQDFQQRIRAYDFSKTDWTRTNKQIAKEVGCCEQLVRIRRPEGTKPSLVNRVDRTQTLGDNSKRLRVSENTLRRHLKNAGVKLPRKIRKITKIDPAKFNWRASSDAEIARAAGVSRQAVASYRRYHNMPRPLEKWRMINPKLTLRENAQKLGRSEATVYTMAYTHRMRFKKLKSGRPAKNRH